MNEPSSKKPKILRRLHASGALPAKQAEAKEKEKRTKEAADRRSRLFRFSISDVSSPIRAREGERHKDYTHKDTEREKSSHRIFRTSARLTGVFLFSLGFDGFVGFCICSGRSVLITLSLVFLTLLRLRNCSFLRM